jgi:hypothetical protein
VSKPDDFGRDPKNYQERNYEDQEVHSPKTLRFTLGLLEKR